MATGELVVTVDAQSDERFRGQASVHAMKLRSVIAAPIRSPEGAVGALYLDNRFLRDRFREVDLDLLRAFADHVGLAIRNARLVEALRARGDALERELQRQQNQIELIASENIVSRAVLDALDRSAPRAPLATRSTGPR